MKIAVINGSPSGENSITLYTLRYIEQHFPQHTFRVIHAARQIKQYERDFSTCAEILDSSDMILFCYPVYTFLVPAQMYRFLELIQENGMNLRGKYATQISTSKHFYDNTAHQFIRDFCLDMGLRYIRGLSADMEDLLRAEGREDAISFFKKVEWNVQKNYYDSGHMPEDRGRRRIPAPVSEAEALDKTSTRQICIVTDLVEKGKPDHQSDLQAMILRFQNRLKCRSFTVNLHDFPFQGGCMGCFHCASDGKCIYKDGFDTLLREIIQKADAIVYAFSIQNHAMGYRFKLYDDRQFCNGHRTVTMGMPVGYLIDGALSQEQNLQILLEGRAEVGGNYLAGIATNENCPNEEIDRLAEEISYAMEQGFHLPANFYGVGGRKIFRDLIYQMRGLMRADHRYYRENGFYDDFPQKKRLQSLGLYFVGALNSRRRGASGIGHTMQEGMTLIYQKALKK